MAATVILFLMRGQVRHGVKGGWWCCWRWRFSFFLSLFPYCEVGILQ
jgi:hypothetical protein